MKQLFFKSNILHIRTNEGEFKVSNPEIIGDPETIKILFNDGKPFGGMPIEPVWPGGVELIEADECGHPCEDYVDVCQYSGCGYKGRKLARLLPKEEKKAESAYKEPQEKPCSDINGPFQYSCVDGCIYPINKPVSAPSESQEEMWNEVNEHINAQIGDYISLEAVKLSFILTRNP